MSSSATCGWKCGDTAVDHQHFAIVIREAGRLLGRLTPDGRTAKNKVYAAILSRETAESVAAQINAKGEFSAKVVTF